MASKGDFPASNGIILLILDIIIYMLLAIYLDAVFPGEYGQRRSPLFCFKSSFWRNISNVQRQPSLFRGMSSVRSDEPQADVEEVPENMRDNLAIRLVSWSLLVFLLHQKQPQQSFGSIQLYLLAPHKQALPLNKPPFTFMKNK